ncbi:MAG: hypothetical protein PHV34_22545 [Verrucomicrobiae bacterium]|nr:hypothetical protein [Verrucomicrobiae bacterium]
MHKLILLAGISLLACTARTDEIQIDVQSDPPLPLENLVKNGGFEDGLEGWKIPDPEGNLGKTWKVALSDEARQGRHSLYIQVSREARHRGRGVVQSLSHLLEKGLLRQGKSYQLSCWIRGTKISNVGGDYCGAGAALAFFSADWKKSGASHARGGETGGGWTKISGKPLACPDWAKGAEINAGAAYTFGEAWIDDIWVAESGVKLQINVTGGPFLQVLVEDENEAIHLDSGRLPPDTRTFSREITAPSGTLFTISIVDRDGKIIRKHFPQPSL